MFSSRLFAPRTSNLSGASSVASSCSSSSSSSFGIGYKKVTFTEGKQDRKRAFSKLVDLVAYLLGKRSGKEARMDIVQFNESDARQRYEARRSRRTLARKSSRITIAFKEKERLLFVSTTDAMVRLDTVLQSEKGRQQVVQKMLGSSGDTAIKIRFCSAVDRFDAVADEKERGILGEALIELFFTETSMFSILDSLTISRQKTILDGNYNQLLEAKREILDELSNNETLMNVIGEVECMEL